MIKKYGFIVKGENYAPETHHNSLDSGFFFTKVVGVSTDEEAILVAREFVQSGIEVIELCGGFGKESAEHLIAEVNTHVPIGYVIFNETEQQKLTSFLSSSSA
ncbi:DUF6506 family protein [Enterovibrio norvegicus]|uniref:Uncharacterized protein n=1 Tax=Enterovibrio norvegicus TaxID=188144 RepID=A0A2N7L778_9GAMM|nr:DUF6506 family protein [Enterovibrio norvegicus]PMN89820.1 hypothetical protein BCT23_22170 [Enterovibrio norvegicus]